MFQAFEWNLPPDASLWRTIEAMAPELRARGFTAVWFPPPCKGHSGIVEAGYGIYDHWDLGEFDQKGSVVTKYGTKDELLRAVAAVQKNGMDAYLDVVTNHRVGGDELAEVTCVEVDPNDRLAVVSEPYPIRAWARYSFPGRGGAHSSFVFTEQHFNAFGHDDRQPEVRDKIYRVADKEFSREVSAEFGNYDYLMGANHDFAHPDVRDELSRWGIWLLETTGARGVRFDAAKHVPHSFAKEWLWRVREAMGDREVFAVGEYWSGDVDELSAYLAATEGAMRLFDVPLHFRLREIGERGREADLRAVFESTLVARAPLVAVTFVDNHDSQPNQSLASPVADWFKPLGYALLLLRNEGYPCVFWGDYFGNDGARGEGERLVSHRVVIDAMLAARQNFLFGRIHDHLQSSTCVGWLASGDAEHPGVMAVVLSTADDDGIVMDTGRPGLAFRDVTGGMEVETIADANGTARFGVRGGHVAVWCSV